MRRIVGVLTALAILSATSYWIRIDRRNPPDRKSSMPAASAATSLVRNGSSSKSSADPNIAPEIGRSAPADLGDRAPSRLINMAPPTYGKVEGRFLTDGMLNANVTRALNSRSFDSMTAELRLEGASENPDRQAAYRIQLEDSLIPYAQTGQLSRFECGKNICMGSIETMDASWSNEWIRSLREQATLPMPALSWRVFTLSTTQEIRFLFTTSPESSGYTSAVH